MSDNIKVVVKVRPLISREIEDKLSYQWRVKNNTLFQLDQNGIDNGVSYTFDKIYDQNTETSKVYDDIAKPIVQAATAGFNGTIFAYGQTSSGKTYTMTGNESSPGIIPMAVLDLFEIIKNIPDRDFLVRVSYIEIYNETVKDLLNVDKGGIKIHEDPLQGIIKVDATEKVASSPEVVLEAMKEGEANRQKGATNMNEESSRSHSIFQITVESRAHAEREAAGCVNVSQLNLVDLAGSERAGQAGATGLRFREGTHINRSLSALALVIKQLSEDPKKHANYRDSKLTRILQNSLGGNAKTSIICAVTPAAVEETVSTLQFATRAKAIKNKPEVNAVTTNATMIQSLTKKMCRLQAQLESKKNLEQDNHMLQNKIANLQKLILNGFAQRRDVELMGGPRRKLQQPRRITISTLHSIEDEPVVTVPKFCTPSLKYNPLALGVSTEFSSVLASSSRLVSVPEEPRLITPPPTRSVNFNDEVIEIDSDDDMTRDDASTCSPIHKCYGASKTPPCILRRNAKVAEKNFKDIVELTEREKMYSPSVVEYIEKLENNATVIANLQDEIEKLNRRSQEKDDELDKMVTRIKKSEEDIRSLTSLKMELQTQCEEFSTKMTDWEVSYETLKNKAKLREEELLSLLDEVTVKNKKPDDMEKILSRTLDKDIQFMDMSKDISLVNSDNEGCDENEINKIVNDSCTQLAISKETIIKLEADIFSQKQKISHLENLNQELLDKISVCQSKLSLLDSENSLLKCNVNTLNSTIQEQKEHLLVANNDIKSYNSVIQELQIKITQKDSSNISINDSVLENMIANEDQFIANNENMKNIIHSLKLALTTRNKEIELLKNNEKSLIDSENDIKILKEQLDMKTQEILKLNEIENDLRRQINDNVSVVTTLMHEKNDLKDIEQKLSEKIHSIESKNVELEKFNNENKNCFEKLKEENDRIAQALADKTVIEQQLTISNKMLLEQIEQMTNDIAVLNKTICDKDNLISTLSEKEEESEKFLIKAKGAVLKFKSILNTLTGNIQEVPEIIDNFVNLFSVLNDSMITLENVATSVVTQKKQSEEKYAEIQLILDTQTSEYNTKIASLQEQINTKYDLSLKEAMAVSNQQINELNGELEKMRAELNSKMLDNKNLEDDLKEATKKLESCNEKINVLETDNAELKNTLIDKEKVIHNITNKIEAIETILDDKIAKIKAFEERLSNTYQERDELLQSIFKYVTDFTNNFNISNITVTSLGVENNCHKIYEVIIKTLDEIGNHISFISSKNDDVDSPKAEAKKILTSKEIIDLTNKVSEIEKNNSELKLNFDTVEKRNEQLNKEIQKSQNIFEDLQIELKSKTKELSVMEEKVKKWKEQFESLDTTMKNQLHELTVENETLKTRMVQKPYIYEHKDAYVVNKRNSIIESDSINEIFSPQSLQTICCNKIINYIQPRENESKTSTDTNATSDTHNINNFIKCKCEQLTTELNVAKEENSRLLDLLEEMEVINQQLIEEQDAVREELQLLVAPAQELQKKVINHKHNLSILTAMTYAENKSLNSQVKSLKHHHSRFHNVCQRDIPDFKKQLHELMTILKGDSSVTHNASFKRYSLPDVLDSSTSVPNFKNESILDGDLLMLDTNITLTTAADNTLAGHDQSCLDLTQIHNETYQTNDLNQMTDENINHIVLLSNENKIMNERLNKLNVENDRLRKLVDNYENMKPTLVDAQNSPIKNQYDESPPPQTRLSIVDDISILYECPKCKREMELQRTQENLSEQLDTLNLELTAIKSQKLELEEKYNNLVLETPSTDILVKKITILQKDYDSKIKEIEKLNNTLVSKNLELKKLQDEYDSLSNEVMEHISETDSLNKELGILKQKNGELVEKCKEEKPTAPCPECLTKEDFIKALEQRLVSTHTKLNRSLSDSDTCSRHNKICTLQSELYAGREDCKVLTEDVVTIKNHLERSNLSMDLDDSMGESNLSSFNIQSNKCSMPDIQEEIISDAYVMDKIDCFNYYAEILGLDKDTINRNVKIVEVMKNLYENLITKHGNEVENLTNKLKDFNESKCQLENECKKIFENNIKVNSELNNVSSTLSKIKSNIELINENIVNDTSFDHSKILAMYKDNFLKVLDSELCLSSVHIFDRIVCKHQSDLKEILGSYNKLKDHMATVSKDLQIANENLAQIKHQLAVKENEYNLLQAQKDRIQEINTAVTLDIINKDKELKEIVSNGFRKLTELNLLSLESVDLTLPINSNVNQLFELLIENRRRPDLVKEKENLVIEVDNLKKVIEEKCQEINGLRSQCNELQQVNDVVRTDLDSKETQIKTLQEEFSKKYQSKDEENAANSILLDKLRNEVKQLEISNETKEQTIKDLERKGLVEQYNEKDVIIVELTETIKGLQNDISNLKAINQVISKENDGYAAELLKAAETIKQNSNDMDKMTSDILILRESEKENSIVIEDLNVQYKNLLKQNTELKNKLDERNKECFQLETNIKTHEKTAEIQSRMIMRLDKQKNEDDNLISEKNKQIEELSEKYNVIKQQLDSLNNITSDELELLKSRKEFLEARVLELELLLEAQKARPSIDSIADNSRRRRQSLYDTKRVFSEDKHIEDHNHAELIFDSRAKPDDFFMDVDENGSNRSTPIRLSKGRESLSHSRTDQSDKDEEHMSRPSSVLATRRRRQSIHDLHRSVLRHTPSPHGLELSNRVDDQSKRSDTSAANDSSEVSQLRERLVSCQQELEDLKEKYRELDEECETCAEYLRERDEQCARLKREKLALQATITELKEKQAGNQNISQLNATKPTVISVAVNTDEDWTNLHSVVVDRMSFDAEVDKNKKLSKTIEELRFKNQDLKNTLGKMQRALEKNGSRELESTKMELQACKHELLQLRDKYKDLDEECETCAQYLREKEEQCRRLKESKAALEAKLLELQGDLSDMAKQSARKKRQSLHDQNRPRTTPDVKDASTETNDDFLSYQPERDESVRTNKETETKENRQSKMIVEKLSQQKAALEQQLVSVSSAMLTPQPMYVATGSAIVQNQQLTDVMKENQKLKKMNAKLVTICKKRGKDSNRENEDPADKG